MGENSGSDALSQLVSGISGIFDALNIVKQLYETGTKVLDDVKNRIFKERLEVLTTEMSKLIGYKLELKEKLLTYTIPIDSNAPGDTWKEIKRKLIPILMALGQVIGRFDEYRVHVRTALGTVKSGELQAALAAQKESYEQLSLIPRPTNESELADFRKLSRDLGR